MDEHLINSFNPTEPLTQQFIWNENIAEELNNYMVLNDDLIKRRAVLAIAQAYYQNEDDAIILSTIIIKNEGGISQYEPEMYIINRVKWYTELSNCLKYFEKLEEYELCDIITNLLKLIKESQQVA